MEYLSGTRAAKLRGTRESNVTPRLWYLLGGFIFGMVLIFSADQFMRVIGYVCVTGCCGRLVQIGWFGK